MQTKTDHHELHQRYFKERASCRHVLIKEKLGRTVLEFISGYVDMSSPEVEVYFTSEPFNLEMISNETTMGLVNLKRVNNIARPNEFFSLVNNKLPLGGYFIGCFESQTSRRARIFKKYRQPFSYPVVCMDFILKRVFPKMKPTRKIYTLLTRGENRVMSMTETLGRLVGCGFKIIDCRDIGYLSYFVCKKTGLPVCADTENSGLLIKLKRVGREGKLFDVYKLRTMYPFSEYLQDYVYELNGICDGDKIVNDFRVTSWGRYLRRFWIDEQPMWLNLLKGDLKLVGVRPLSEHKLSIYPKELRERRLKFKPGLFPPYYADRPKTNEEFFETEDRYLDSYEKNPFLTDFRYFFRILYNILFKKARSA